MFAFKCDNGIKTMWNLKVEQMDGEIERLLMCLRCNLSD